MASAVMFGTVGQSFLDRIVLIGGPERQSRTSTGADGDRIPSSWRLCPAVKESAQGLKALRYLSRHPTAKCTMVTPPEA